MFDVVNDFSQRIVLNIGFIYNLVARQSTLNGKYFNGAYTLSTLVELQVNQMNYF